MADETLQRVRRIETRLTALCNAQGLDVGGNRPQFVPSDGTHAPALHLPSQHTTMQAMLDSIPEGWQMTPIDVFLDGKIVASLSRSG